MTTLLYMHPSSLEHDTGPGHPESSARIRAITTMLEREERKGALGRRRASRAAAGDARSSWSGCTPAATSTPC